MVTAQKIRTEDGAELTIRELAERSGVHESTTYKRLRRGLNWDGSGTRRAAEEPGEWKPTRGGYTEEELLMLWRDRLCHERKRTGVAILADFAETTTQCAAKLVEKWTAEGRLVKWNA